MRGRNRTRIGYALVTAGLLLLITGVIGLVGSDEDDVIAAASTPSSLIAQPQTPTDSTAPTTTLPPPPSTTSSVVSTTTSPPATTTTVPAETPEEFLTLLVEGLRGDLDFLVSRLNPATIAIYGEDQCRTTLAALIDPEASLELRELGGTGPWDYVIDDITTTIPDALAVEVQRLAQGQTLIQELHWQLVEGQWTWFSDCGDPLADE